MNVNHMNNLKNIESFNGNFAVYYNTDGMVGIINRQGEIVLEADKFEFAREVENGIFVLDNFSNDAHLTFDAKTSTRLTEKHVLHHGTTISTYEENQLIGLCDENYETIIEPSYEILLMWKDRLIGKKDGKWGIVNYAGETIVPFIYEAHTVIAANMADYNHRAVALNGVYFWIDVNGNRISKNTYEYLQPRNANGYAIMKQNGRLGIIDANENVLCLTDYSEVDDGQTTYSRFYWCTPEHIAFYKEGFFGIMDVCGNVLVEPKFTKVDFQADDMLIRATDANKKQGLVTPEGKVVIPFEYDFLARRRMLGLNIVRKGGKYGVIDNKGQIVLPLEYESIGLNGNKSLAEMAVKKDGECYFINERQERINMF